MRLMAARGAAEEAQQANLGLPILNPAPTGGGGGRGVGRLGLEAYGHC